MKPNRHANCGGVFKFSGGGLIVNGLWGRVQLRTERIRRLYCDRCGFKLTVYRKAKAKWNARELRAAGLLWPENLTDAELADEIRTTRTLDAPISARVLQAELDKRQHNAREGKS